MTASPTLLPSAVLSAAADLIEKPGAWTSKELARDASGKATAPDAPNAVCWCMAGAIQKWLEPFGKDADVYTIAIRKADLVTDGLCSLWNDRPGRAQAEVVAALRKASELAKQEGQ